MTLNMNNRVTVTLTETGLRILDRYEAALGLPERHRRMDVTDGNRWRGELVFEADRTEIDLMRPGMLLQVRRGFNDNELEFVVLSGGG